jgi:Holliday junction resolvase
MANPSKRKGTAWERAVQDYLNEAGVWTRRMPPSGSKDVGDLQAEDRDGDLFIVECKATKAIDLAGAVKEAQVEAENAGATYGVAAIKRRQKGVAEGYVVMTLADFAELVRPERQLASPEAPAA